MRARTIEELIQNMVTSDSSRTPVDLRHHEPQDGDVYITSWAKSGTTMMQQMFHQLRTGGDEEFDDISRVVPWDDTAEMLDFDMTAPQKAHPRGFKSHREYERLPTAGRYVVTLRDPKESYVSFYRFMNGWQIEDGAVSLADFMPLWMSGGPGGCDYFTHLLSWYARRENSDTLLASYRWAVKNKRMMIERLAQLCDVEVTVELLALVEQRTSRQYMVEHKDKFDDLMVARALEEQRGIPASSDSSKVQAEGSASAILPDETAAAIDAMWAEKVLPATGHADFGALAEEIDG